MANFRFGAAALGLTFAAVIAAPAFAVGSEAECSAEGGSLVNVKGSDFCLVPIRPAEYAGPEYDGNQLGIVDCPGDKLNDGAYCMAPITGKSSTSSSFIPSTPSVTSNSSVTSDVSIPSTSDLTQTATDAVKDRATDAANDVIQDQAEKQAKKKGKGFLSGITGK